jgi:two-component system CheB/CheR fusion protein
VAGENEAPPPQDDGLGETGAEDDVEDSGGEPQDARPAEDPGSRFFIVGVGASAGGLEALSALLKGLSLDSMAIVIVQHLAPKYESVLPTLLSRSSEIAAVSVEDGMRVEPGHIYVIPPNTDLAILQGVLHLMPPPAGAGHRPRLPVDYFFRSLAEDQGSRAIGVVLSGTGSDGTLGLRAIKDAGGITFAQDPVSARYDGMPRSAIESGAADLALSPAAIADELARIRTHPYLARPRAAPPAAQENVAKLIVLMRTAFGNDLTYYKPTTMDRRIERRMALHKIEKLADYVKFVQSSADELRLLYQDMLISVTSFFRDREPFEVLKSKILPRILETKEAGGPIRIWVPACSTGEEAYSIAIALLEVLDDRAQDFRLQVFGTDVDEASIQTARRGVFPPNIALDVSSERLQRFFVKKQNEYQVCRRIRDLVVFSNQNLIRDAPFSRLDVVSCRNLLIYLRPSMQKKVLRILHYALLPTGYLMLGTSETVGDLTDYFSLVDRKNKLYAKRQVAATAAFDVGFGVRRPEALPSLPSSTARRSGVNLSGLADRKILEIYGPPGVVINEDLDVIQIRGRTRGYLEPMPGAPSFNVLRLARPDLHAELRRAIHEAKSTNRRATVEAQVKDGGVARAVTIEVLPLVDPETKVRCLMVLFQEPTAESPPGDVAPEAPARASAEEERTRELERDLLLTKEYLQSTIEELETANEELKSSNEELQSSNEELQSTNEELETSKEELQSSNEELTTVNDELQNRMSELQISNDDLHNVLAGIDSALIILGLDLRIRRYTQAAETLMNLVPGDIGRSASQLDAFLPDERIQEVAARVIETLVPFDKRILGANQRSYDLRVIPYRTLDHAIKGVVVILEDVEARGREAEPTRQDSTSARAGLDLSKSRT